MGCGNIANAWRDSIADQRLALIRADLPVASLR